MIARSRTVAPAIVLALVLTGLAEVGRLAAAAPLPDPPELTVPAAPIVPSTNGVGYLPGSWAVSPTGQFRYTVPLDVPPARAGRQPDLALVYSGGTGDGTLGVGWALAGASSRISWCGDTRSTEGATSGVRLEGDDRLCLDGAKLVAVSGAYGASDTRYRTEMDSFTEIISGPAGEHGPEHFTVRTKDGLVKHYQSFSATRRDRAVALLTTGPVEAEFAAAERPVFWLLSREEDRSGNAMSFEYENVSSPPATPEIELRRIRYTWYGGEAAQRTVELRYENRPDTTSVFQAGVRFDGTRRISSIVMHAPNPATVAPVWRYDLGYTASATGRSLLTTVARCAPSGGCLRAKSFTWQQHTAVPAFTPVDVGPAPVDLTHFSARPGMHVADLNGDGASDVLYTLGGSATAASTRVRLGTRTPSGGIAPLSRYHDTAALAWPDSVDLTVSRPLDVDADGQQEFLAVSRETSGSGEDGLGGRLLRWNDSSQSFGQTGVQVASPSPMNFADVNGDGLADLVTANVPQAGSGDNSGPDDPENPQPPQDRLYNYSVRLNTGEGFGPAVSSTLSAADRRAVVRVTDTDADGRSELTIGSYQVRADDSGAVTGRSGTTSADGRTWYRVPPLNGRVGDHWYQYELVDGDFNGDSLTDWLLVPDQASKPATLLWNTGTGLTIAPDPVPVPRDDFQDVRAADLDGDGRDDLVSFHSVTTVLTSRGDGRFTQGQIAADGGTAHPQAGHTTSRVGDFDGDGRLDVVRIVGGRMVVLLQHQLAGDRITAVTEQGTAWPAQTVTYSTTYGPAQDTASCDYPQVCLRGGLLVVRQVDSRAEHVDPVVAARPARSYRYTYQDPRVDLLGRGFLGFGTVTSLDAARPALTTTTYDHTTRADDRLYPFAGRPATVTKVLPILTEARTAQQPATATARVVRGVSTPQLRRLNGGRSYVVFGNTSVTKEWEQQVALDWGAGTMTGVAEPATVLRTRTTADTYDDHGNRTRAVTATAQGVTEDVRTDYDNRPGDWLISLPTTHRVTRTEPGGASTTRHGARHYDALGRLDAEHTEPDNPDPDVRTSTAYQLDKYGLVHTATATTPGQRPRVSHTEYAPVFPNQPDEKVFASRVWSEHSVPRYAPSQWTAVHPAYGVTVASMDSNGVQATTWFDDQGRPVRVEEDGLDTAVKSYANRPDAAGGSNGTVVTATMGPQTSRSVTDALGRTLSSSVTGFDGTPAVTTTRYDRLGRTVSTTGPAPVGTSTATFDSLDRRLTGTAPDGATTTHTHAFASSATVDPSGGRVESHRDVDGRVLSTVRYLEVPGQRPTPITTRYTYAPFDLVATVADDRRNVASYTYDVHGRPVRTVDPDRGATVTSYFGSGELDTETHEATGEFTRLVHDDLGRVESKVTRDGVSSFTFDTAANGIGKLATSVGPDRIRVDHTYEQHGRPESQTYTDESTGTGYGIHRRYNASGQLHTLTYPAGLTVRYDYNQHGFLRTVNDVSNPAAPSTVWQVNSRNPDQSLAQAKLGPFTLSNSYQPKTGRLAARTVTDTAGTKVQDLGYTYHADGLVASRTDAVNGRAESFGFDSLDRLTTWELDNTGGAPTVTGYDYDTIDNLTAVTRDGQVVQQRRFGRPGGGQPHTLTSLTPAGGTAQVSGYDQKGRQNTGNGRAVTYTNADLPRTVVRAGVTTRYAYDANGAKAKQSAPDATTYYLPGLYERRDTAGGTTHVYHLSTPDGPIGQVVKSASGSTMEYATADQLGSITATATANAAGAATGVRQLFYEPFGARINSDGSAFTGYTGALTRGFTGHEHTPEVGLINMNGRVFDPDQRTFLSTDPLNAAGGNPYAYVGNSPLNHTDPSGYTAKDGVQHWRDAQQQAAFDEFAAAGEAYQEGGAMGLQEHQLGGLFRGVASYNRAVDAERRIAAEAAYADAVKAAVAAHAAAVARASAVRSAAALATSYADALGLADKPGSTSDLRQWVGMVLLSIVVAHLPDDRLAMNENRPGEGVRDASDPNFQKGAAAGTVIGLTFIAAAVAAAKAAATVALGCARFSTACIAAATAAGRHFGANGPSAEDAAGQVADAVADAAPTSGADAAPGTLRSPVFFKVVDRVPDVPVVTVPYFDEHLPLPPMGPIVDAVDPQVSIATASAPPLRIAEDILEAAVQSVNDAMESGSAEDVADAMEEVAKAADTVKKSYPGHW